MPNINKPFARHESCMFCGKDLFGVSAENWSFSTSKSTGKRGFYHKSCAGLQAPPPPKPFSNPQPQPAFNPPPQTFPMTQETKDRAKDLLRNGRAIEAIKAIREQTNLGLYEAKQLADTIKLEIASEKQATPSPNPNRSVTVKPMPPSVLDIDTTGLHSQTDAILKRMKQGLNVFLYGAPGAGKTTLGQMIAQRAKLDFLLLPCSPDMLRSEILGTKNPFNGDFNVPEFFNFWSNGGIIFIDEVGNAAGPFLNTFNSMLANKEIRFPNGARVTKHKDCYFMFADNSNLWGDDPRYPERQDAGSAFRNRLCYIKFEYDEKLERRVIEMKCPEHAAQWHGLVLEIRRIIEKHQLPISASPRFAYAGADILAYEPRITYKVAHEIMDAALWEGLSEDVIGAAKADINQILNRL